MGDAVLQKEITVDFLTKTRKPNEGEVSQYYVENGHPGIVNKSVWQEVQATWTDASRRNSTFSPIANKIICGDCGGRYGRKTWHSTTYRDAVWECNGKKAGRTKCKCCHIYAEELDNAIRRSMHHLLKTHHNIILQAKSRKAKYFCSDKCRNVWWNAHPEKVQRKAYYHLTCEYCGKEFISYGNRKRKYCSRPCYADARRSHPVSDTLRNAG
ncbi:MAG: zinc ribbon domain-containing protein [bacterium]|nr:zinc ribbon domain-containing protein [bacterium]